MESAEVVVIGGGCVGASTLFHLTELGCTDTVLLEREVLAAGSTSKAAGGIRLQHSEEVNTRIALRSLAEFLEFEAITGEPIFFRQVGYLICFDDETDLAGFSGYADAQSRLGIPTEVLTPEQAREHVPGMVTEDLVGATYCPWEGYASPEAVVQGYATAARRRGARVRTGREVTGIATRGDRVVGVETSQGPIATDTVVIAAGVHSGVLAAPLGFELPVEGMARTIFYSAEDGGVPAAAPLVVDFSAGFYFHREGSGLLFAGRQSDLAELADPAVHRLPAIADISINTSWWGYYDMSPDHSALIGRSPVEGCFYATGFSGHGFMQSPAVGEHVAQLVTGATPSLDLSSLSVDRLAAGVGRVESYGV
jgi:sarcosine oxidase, subunit beta